MYVSRTQQAVQEHCGSLGIDYSLLQYAYKQCRGLVADKYTRWFCELFLTEKHNYYNIGDTYEEVREKLQNAYWIDEEDFIQEMIIYMVSRDLRDLRFHHIGYIARDVMLFKFQCMKHLEGGWEEGYTNYIYDINEREVDYDFPSLYHVLEGNQLTLLQRYIIYLKYTMYKGRNMISDTLLCNQRYTNRLLLKLYKDIGYDRTT